MKKQEIDINSNETKKCNKCGEVKLLSEFAKNKNTKDGLNYLCILCTKKHYEKYYIENKDHLLNYVNERNKENKPKRKIYNQENKEHTKEYDKKYKSENKPKIYIYNKCRKEKDPCFKLSSLIRSRIGSALKHENKTESITGKISSLIGCSITEFKQHLEQQFLPEMNWDNHGKVWEIDHIIPIVSFNILDIEEQKKCFNYTNHQPLFKTTSIAESLGYIGYIGNRNKHAKLL